MSQVPRQKCIDVPRQECTNVPQTECEDVPSQQCGEVCENIYWCKVHITNQILETLRQLREFQQVIIYDIERWIFQECVQ